MTDTGQADDTEALNALPATVLIVGGTARNCLDAARQCTDISEVRRLLKEADEHMAQVLALAHVAAQQTK